MITTTYQHDYIPPLTKRYDVEKPKEQNDKTAACQCTNEYKVEVPKTKRKPPNVEWTGIAPMGRIIYPRNIPTKFTIEQLDVMLNENQDCCSKMQQNSFLKILPKVYPYLYDRLKEMPMDELNRGLDNDRMCTTYQIDFCGVNEYPQVMYKYLKVESQADKLKASNDLDLVKKESTCNVIVNDSWKQIYKPFKTSYIDSGNSSHWRSNVFTSKAKFSEYMDTISKIGCAITKNHIHDHNKCNKRNCRHKLVHGCNKLT